MVVKRGSLGALFASRAGESGTAPAEPVEGRNSVGAGDTLNGRLVHGLSRGESLADAVAAAVELATNTVRNGRGVLGAFDGLRVREAIGDGETPDEIAFRQAALTHFRDLAQDEEW